MTVLRDEELERKTLGACLLRPELLLELPLAEADFASEQHRAIWGALLYLHAEGDGVDTLRLHDRLASARKLELAGGHSYLLGLTDTIPAGLPPTRRLRELTRLRALETDTRKLLKACGEGDYEQALALAAGLEVLGTDASDEEVVTCWDCAEAVYDELHGKRKRALDVHPGLPLMAEQIGHLPLPSMTILGADTNVGKSSIALEMLVHAAQRNVTGAYISREDPKVLIGRRFLSMLSGVSAKRIRRRELEDADWSKLSHAATTLQHIAPKLLVSQRRGGTELDACAAMTRAAQRGAKLVVVDYVQAIELSGRVQDRRNEVAKVAARIGAHADRLGVALVLLSQLTIPPGGAGKEPEKHWLKETRDLANMTDVLLLAWREQEDEFAPIRLKVAKGKDGGLTKRWTMQRSQQTGRLEEVGP